MKALLFILALFLSVPAFSNGGSASLGERERQEQLEKEQKKHQGRDVATEGKTKAPTTDKKDEMQREEEISIPDAEEYDESVLGEDEVDLNP